MKHVAIVVASVLLGPAFAPMAASAAQQAAGSPARPRHVFVLTGRNRAQVLEQCSRSAPKRGEAWFRPNAAQIAALDHAAALAVNARAKLPRVRGARGIAASYGVEVVGIVRGGRGYVYGNYYPYEVQTADAGYVAAMVVCDGGPAFFGVEIAIATGRTTHYDDNGMD